MVINKAKAGRFTMTNMELFVIAHAVTLIVFCFIAIRGITSTTNVFKEIIDENHKDILELHRKLYEALKNE